MADWARFCDFWAANFSPLRENDGLAVWREFVADQRTDQRLLEQALRPLAEAYGRAIDAMQPARRPTLAAVKSAYFGLLGDMRRARRASTGCATCGGGRWVCVAVKESCDPRDWPPMYRYVKPEDFAGTELVPCPDCGDVPPTWGPERLHLVRERALPERLQPGDPRIPAEYADCGAVLADRVIRAAVLGGRR